jgi:hypothetical protein
MTPKSATKCIVAMLTKLLMRFDPERYRIHESTAFLATPFEHDDDVSAEALAQAEHEHD